MHDELDDAQYYQGKNQVRWILTALWLMTATRSSVLRVGVSGWLGVAGVWLTVRPAHHCFCMHLSHGEVDAAVAEINSHGLPCIWTVPRSCD